MSVPAMSSAPFLIDGGATAEVSSGGLYDELLERASRDDYPQWLSIALSAGGCVRPIRLRGTVRDLDPASGEVVHALDTEDTPDKVIYLPCGDRRASVCPPCAETYRADIYQLIRAGLAGGKGMPESVSVHPCVFATFTAPSFGPVHTRVELPGGDRRPVQATTPKPATARMGAACPAGSGIRKATPAWASRCVRTATTTTPPWCGTRTRPSCGGAPSSRCAAAWTKQAKASRRPGQAVVRQGRRVPAPRADPLPRHLPPRRRRPGPPRADRAAAPRFHRRGARRPHPPGR